MDGGVRLCPCVPKQRARQRVSGGGEKVVAEVVTRLLKELDAQVSMCSLAENVFCY